MWREAEAEAAGWGEQVWVAKPPSDSSVSASFNTYLKSEKCNAQATGGDRSVESNFWTKSSCGVGETLIVSNNVHHCFLAGLRKHPHRGPIPEPRQEALMYISILCLGAGTYADEVQCFRCHGCCFRYRLSLPPHQTIPPL
eukprot:gene18925-biopygen5736